MIGVVIPAYKPDSHLPELAQSFLNLSDTAIVVVDDGSGEEYQGVFEALPPEVTVLRHPVNRGKGAALKTAFAKIRTDMPEWDGVITVDADGQHLPEDARRVLERLCDQPDALVLGSRAFDGEVPFRSRFGNAMTRQVFAIASGVKVRDTQTGLRAFGRNLLERFCLIPGDRYEYEINMLLDAARSGVPIVEETIRTVYLDQENSSSHFHAVRDSIRIYLCILKFVLTSVISFGVDIGLGALLNLWLSVSLSNVLARCVSAPVNFWLNRRVTFQGNETLLKAAGKYAALAILVLAANTLLLYVLVNLLSWPWLLGKITVEVVLFVLNFVLQGRIVYRARRKDA